MKHVIVIGGGAAGCMAAVAAAQKGAAVTLLERNPKLGRKLYITGKGRCNVTNDCAAPEVLQNVPRNSRFLTSAVTRFPPEAVKAFFEGLGVPLKTERGNRVFPCSDKAADIIDALLLALRRSGVHIVQDRARALRREGEILTGVEGERGFYPGGAVVIATGGVSYPLTGSTGDGYALAEALGQIMAEQRYQADVVFDGADGLGYALTGQYDAIVLDVMLPKVDGFEVARRLRCAHVSTPILMLTARDEIPDKIAGLDHGADDYMTKPFDIGELLARVRALTRRQGEVIGEQLAAGDLVLDTPTRSLRCGEKSVRLGFKEFDVLRLLLAAPRAVIPKEDIISKVWGLESEAEDNNVEVYISFLRKKLAYLGSRVSIGTVRKVGYHLEVPGV